MNTQMLWLIADYEWAVQKYSDIHGSAHTQVCEDV